MAPGAERRCLVVALCESRLCKSFAGWEWPQQRLLFLFIYLFKNQQLETRAHLSWLMTDNLLH